MTSLYYNHICYLCFSVFCGGLILFVTIYLSLCLFVSCLIPPLNDKPQECEAIIVSSSLYKQHLAECLKQKIFSDFLKIRNK